MLKFKKKSVISIVLAIAVFISMIPAFNSEAAAKNKKVTMYVLSKITYPYAGTGYKTVYSYNKTGLITKKIEYKAGNRAGTSIYTYDSNRNIKKSKEITGNNSHIENYYYKKDKLIKQIYDLGGANRVYTYTWKKNRITKMTHTFGSDVMGLYFYSYDSKGNLESTSYSGGGYSITYTNILSYKNNRLVKQTQDGKTVKYFYKKITVSSKNVEKIKRQQWYFINGFFQ